MEPQLKPKFTDEDILRQFWELQGPPTRPPSLESHPGSGSHGMWFSRTRHTSLHTSASKLELLGHMFLEISLPAARCPALMGHSCLIQLCHPSTATKRVSMCGTCCLPRNFDFRHKHSLAMSETYQILLGRRS